MNKRQPPDLEMTVDGQFVAPPKPTIATRILLWSIIVAVVAGALAFAALALWVALSILPIALGAAVIAWAMLRYRMWRAQRGFGPTQNVWRP